MAKQLTAADARQSLTDHVESKGLEIFGKYGPVLGWAELQRLLEDRAYVRYPVEIAFDASPLQLGEFAHPVQKGESPEDGFTMYVHPMFMLDLPKVPHLVLYQLVAVNYGDFAGADEAETFGAAALGLTRDEYYNALCEFSNQVGGEDAPEPVETEASEGCGCGGGGCGCS